MNAEQNDTLPHELVACATWREFAERHADDLQRGGMFIPTQKPHRVWSYLHVTLRLPAGHDITMRGRVVHIIDAEKAAAKSVSPGIGVEFVQLDAARLHGLNQLLHYARTEGSKEHPSYTFAQWLAQHAQQQPPQQVMASLPPAGPGHSRRRTDRPEVARPMRPDSSQSAVRPRSDRPLSEGDGSTRYAMRPPSNGSARQSARTLRPEDFAQAQRASLPPERARTSQRPTSQRVVSQRPQERTSMPPRSGRPEPRPSQAPQRASGPPRRTSSSQNLRAAAGDARPDSGRPAGNSMRPGQPSVPPEPPHPTRNPDAIKLGVTHLAHRRYTEAQVVFREVLEADPADVDAQRWMHMSCARAALAGNKRDEAIAYYRKVQAVDPGNREARDKIATLQRNAKLESIPFGRFFAKK